jgi:anthranilate phosphoribosyltransferase
MAPKMVRVLAAGGAEHVMVVHGHPGLDELSTAGPSTVHEYRRDATSGEHYSTWSLEASEVGLACASLEGVLGGDAAANAMIIKEVLGGGLGARRDIVVLNAAAGLVVAGRCPGLVEAVAMAQAAIDDGRAAKCREALVAVSQGAPREPGE